MNVFMYVFIYVCMYVCMYVWLVSSTPARHNNEVALFKGLLRPKKIARQIKSEIPCPTSMLSPIPGVQAALVPFCSCHANVNR